MGNTGHVLYCNVKKTLYKIMLKALILARQNKTETREYFAPTETTSLGSYQVSDVRACSVVFASTLSLVNLAYIIQRHFIKYTLVNYSVTCLYLRSQRQP